MPHLLISCKHFFIKTAPFWEKPDKINKKAMEVLYSMKKFMFLSTQEAALVHIFRMLMPRTRMQLIAAANALLQVDRRMQHNTKKETRQ